MLQIYWFSEKVMSEAVVGDQNGPLAQLHVNGQSIENKSLYPPPPNMIIESSTFPI
jgi:hypothetical protein